MSYKRPSMFALILALVAAGSAQALGPGRDDGKRIAPGLDLRQPPSPLIDTPRPLPRLSEDEVARQAQQRYGGKVLAVRPQGNGEYRVKVLKDGEVRTHSFEPH